jgi:hypothetical protein
MTCAHCGAKHRPGDGCPALLRAERDAAVQEVARYRRGLEELLQPSVDNVNELELERNALRAALEAVEWVPQDRSTQLVTCPWCHADSLTKYPGIHFGYCLRQRALGLP